MRTEGTMSRKTMQRVIRHAVPPGTTLPEEERAGDRRVRQLEARERLGDKAKSLPEQIAGHPFHYRNKFCPELQWAFDRMPRMWHVSLFFPYADGGPLYIDLPVTAEDVVDAKAKQVVMLEKGLRMVVIEQSHGYNDALAQLGEQAVAR